MTNEEAANVLRIMASGIELKGYTEHWISGFKEAYEMAIKVLEERSKGEWIGDADYESYQGNYEGYKCNKCGYSLHWRDYYANKYNFCPNCGAEMMKGDTDESES